MDESRTYYFDNNATTRVAPEVVEAMLPMLTDHWGNPSSAYRMAKEAARRIELAREQLAGLLNATPPEIVFTSCGTESNNAAIRSALLTQENKRHIVTTAVEHSANIKFCAHLEQHGYRVTYLPVEPDGSLDLHLLEKSIRPDTAIVSVMWANNETGVVFPIEEIAALCRSKDVLFHTDAVQVPGKRRVDVREIGADYLSLSAHKLHAPKGVGLLYVKRRVRYHPYVMGGGQERGRRGGTENTVHIVGFGRAAELAHSTLEDENTRVRSLRDRLERWILKHIPRTSRNGAKEPRLPNTANLAFEGLEAEPLMTALDQLGVCVSAGSACTTGLVEPSHVLTAMGVPPARAKGSIRFSLGIYNTDDEVDYLIEHLPGLVAAVRKDGRPGRRRT
jgi:cysteine desulfurase